MASFVKSSNFSYDSARGIHDFSSHSFYFALTNTLPTSSTNKLSDVTQITAANGYPSGGYECPISEVSSSNGITSIISDEDIEVIANGGTMATWQWIILYNNSATDKNVIGWCDYGSPRSLANGAKVTILTAGVRGLIS